MTFPKLIVALACLMSATLVAQQAKVTQLMSKDLTDLPGKEGLMITVEYPPGAADPVHRHYADAFLYVLEGSVVMQVKGGKEVTLGQVRPFMKASAIFMSLAEMQAIPSQRNFSWSWLRKQALRC